MQPSRGFRLFAFIAFATFAVATSARAAQEQTKHAPTQQTAANPANPKIRAITAFINLDWRDYQKQIADALNLLHRAQVTFESRGYQVQTIRIATQPFPEYIQGMNTQQAVAFFKLLDALTEQQKFAMSIGPAMLNANDPPSQADMLGEILASTKNLNGTVVVAGEDGVRWSAIAAAARLMKKLENSTEHSQGNFRFAAIANVPPVTPFFPAAYHNGFGHQFAIALESAPVVAAAFKDAPDLPSARQRLTDALANVAFDVERHAGRVDAESGWTYMGIDLSPAPSPAKDTSIGAAIESLTKQPFGMSGTMTAAATITAAIKDVKVKQTGYTGLMLPILEDARLAQRWSEGRISVDALLAYSAVCGTGLDTIPLPGDTTPEQLSLIIADMASLSVKWHKPLSARLLPVVGKGWGETTEFDNPFLVNVTIQQFGQK